MTQNQSVRTRTVATLQDVEFLKSRGEKIETLEAVQALIDEMPMLEYVKYLQGKIEGAPKTLGTGIYEPKAGVETVEIFLNHPITHDNCHFSRGLHTVEAELAALFLSYKDPINRRPIAELPMPTGPVRGTVAN